MKKCMNCGLKNGMKKKNLKNSSYLAQYYQYNKIVLKTNILLNFCENCENISLFSEDCEKLDKAAKTSVAHYYLNHVSLKNNESLSSEIRVKHIDEDISIYVFYINNNIPIKKILKNAEKIIESNKNKKLSFEEFVICWNTDK